MHFYLHNFKITVEKQDNFVPTTTSKDQEKKRDIQGWGFLSYQSMEVYGPKQSTSIQYFWNKNSFMAVLILKMFYQQIPEKKMGKSLLSGSRGVLQGGFRHLRYSSPSQQKGNLFKMVYFWIFLMRNPIRFSSIVYNEKASDNTHVHIFSFLSIIYGHL